MKLNLKKTLSILIVACMLLSAVPFAASAAATVSTWADLASALASASSGDTITLGADITATGPITVNGSVTINGGKTITRAASSADNVFIVNGSLTLAGVTVNGNRTSTALADLANALIVVNNGATLNLNSGTVLTTNRANAVVSGGGVTVSGGTLNMNAGAVIQDMHVHNATANGAQYVGPAVTVFSGAFNMNGGIIRYCDGNVGAVGILSGTFTMFDGTISDSIANNNGVGGGGVYNAGTFNMNGGAISGNTSWKNGGGVYNTGTFNLTSGEISGNSATIDTSSLDCNGAGVYTIGTMTMSGGSITNNTAKGSAGGILVEGGVCTMTGGEISGNSTVSYSGGGVFAGGTGAFNMSGGTITGNTAKQFGGAIAVTSTASRPIYVTGGVIVANTCGASNCGADIYVTTDGNVAATTLGSGCIQYKLYLDNTNNRYSASNAHLVSSSSLTKNYGYIYVMSGNAHTFGEWTVSVQPGCTTTGIRTRSCTVCGATEEEVIPAQGHTLTSETVLPSCTTDGYTRVYCMECGYEQSRTVLNATGHIPGSWKITTPATASSAGTKVKYCLTCGAVADTASYTLNDAIVSVSFSEPVEFDEDYNTVTATVAISNNPGLWALGFYLSYDPAFTVISAEYGSVFGNGGDTIGATDINVASDSRVSAVFAEAGESANGVLALCYYDESDSLSNVYTSGTLATVVFKYDADLDGVYHFGFAADPANVIDADGEDVDVLFASADEVIEPIIVCDHVPGGWTTSDAATCTESGLRVKTCTICGRIVEREVIAPLGHSAGGWVVTVQPGVNEGERVKYCTRCNIVLESEILRPTQRINVYASDVTATTGGSASFDLYLENNTGIWGARIFVYYSDDISVSSVENGNIFSTESIEIGDYNIDPYTNPIASPIFSAEGITEQGIRATCIYFEADAFSNVTANGKLATVTFSIPDGVTGEYTIHVFCDDAIDAAMNDVSINCYDAELTVVNCIHANTSWSVTTAPTCTETGTRSLICSDCGAVLDTESIPANGHTPSAEWTTSLPATCTAAGTKIKTCTVCGAVVDTASIPATGHTPSAEWTTTVEPTCTGTGVKVKTCTVCGTVVETATIPANGHTPGEPVTIAPTCTESGLMTIRCTVCNQIISSSYAEPLGHDLGEWTVISQPTCTEGGTRARYCSRCDYYETESIPANGHTFSDEWTVDVEPTTTTPGQKSHHCIYCDAVTDVTVIDPISDVLIGDVNGDGAVNLKDLTLLKKYKAGSVTLDDIVAANSDIDGDGTISLKDIPALRRLISGAAS